MPSDNIDYRNIESEVVGLFTRLHSELPLDVASLAVRREMPDGIGVVVTLNPRNPASASICAHAENGLALVDFSFGVYGSTWELPFEGINPDADKKEVLREIEEMCAAVIAGKCRHERGVLSITGILELSGKPRKITDFFIFRPDPPFHGIKSYEPYLPER